MIKNIYLTRWFLAANVEGIPLEAFEPSVRVLDDPLNKQGLSFGLIYNPNRFKRPEGQRGKIGDGNVCNLCNAMHSALNDSRLNLDLERKLPGFIVTTNKYPIIKGFSLAISNPEKEMWTTENLDGFEEEMSQVLAFSNLAGFELYHNSPGFGATIPRHEHWHLTNFQEAHHIAGRQYGFDKMNQSLVESGISQVVDFPFAHLIFERSKASVRIPKILAILKRENGYKWDERGIPHTLSEVGSGIVLAIGNKYRDKTISSGEVVGNFPVKTEEEFKGLRYEDCMNRLKEILIDKKDLDLTRFV